MICRRLSLSVTGGRLKWYKVLTGLKLNSTARVVKCRTHWSLIIYMGIIHHCSRQGFVGHTLRFFYYKDMPTKRSSAQMHHFVVTLMHLNPRMVTLSSFQLSYHILRDLSGKLLCLLSGWRVQTRKLTLLKQLPTSRFEKCTRARGLKCDSSRIASVPVKHSRIRV